MLLLDLDSDSDSSEGGHRKVLNNALNNARVSEGRQSNNRSPSAQELILWENERVKEWR